MEPRVDSRVTFKERNIPGRFHTHSHTPPTVIPFFYLVSQLS